MTSTTNPQHPQAPNPSAAAPSYASAAGASHKSASTPVIATGSNLPTPVVVGGSSAHNAKPSGPSSLNGRPAITPAVPATHVAHGSGNNMNINGATGDHSRKSSVTISANGPNNYGPNGGAAPGASKAPSSLKFGFDGSPAIAHSSPHMGATAPINIQGGNGPNQRVPSPAHSPSPIPQQPIASGGRPPSGISQQNTQMTFGSLGSDGDRHMRQGSVPPQNPASLASQAGAHIRRESAVSQHSDMSAAGGRPNFNHQGGRGRGGPGFNPQHPPPYNNNNNNNNNMGFPPTTYARPNATGRGGPAMPPPFQPGRPMGGYPNSPGPGRSPALAHAQPGLSQPGTPNMGTIHPANMGTPPAYHYGAPMPQPQYQYTPYGAQYDPRHSGFAPQPFLGQGPAGSPSANFHPPQFTAPPFHNAAPQAMSRTSSHSDRPPSSTGQTNQPPVVVSSSQPQNGQGKAGLGTNFRPPKKSAAITIKNAAGEALDFSSMKAPASPSPSIQQSKTPPVATSTPPPTQKPGAAVAHARNESQSTPKSAKEIQEELRAKIMAAALGEEKSKEDAPAKLKPADEKKAETEAAPAAVVEPEIAEDAELEQKEEKPAPLTTSDEPSVPVEDEEDEMERAIREMEELDAKREKEAAEYEAKKKAKLEEEKKQEALKKVSSPEDEDKKLREAEAEAERLEEEKEKRRAAAEASGVSVADLLKGKTATPPLSEASKVNDVADKLAGLTIGKDAKPSAAEKPRAAKPPALNLAPINTKPVEPPQPSAALQSLKSARFLTVMKADMYPTGIQSPNPALNAAVAKKGKAFKYDAQFLLQFQKVFTEQPSMEFHQQVKSLIGDTDGSRSASTPRPGNSRQASRSGAFPPSQQNNMGSFASARGTTSAERFARSNAAMSNGMPAPGGMGSFGRTGSFPIGAPMSRSASSANMAAPNSPRTGSRRGASRRGGESARDAQAAKNMPLTAGQDLKPITVSSSGWKPTSIGGKSAAAPSASTGNMDPEMVQRKVKANLNKMTPEKFDKIADQILVIAAQSKNESDGRTLRQVIQLTFEKATDEAHWASMYAKFCKRMLDTISNEIRDETLKDKNGDVVSGGALFRKYLLNRCQEEFERGWKVNLPEKPVEDAQVPATGEAAMLSDEYYIAATAKRRGLGLVQFIGELYKLGMLTERIMHACVQKLVDYETTPEEAEIESLSKLVRTIGANIDASPKGKGVMDVYFDRIQGIINMPDLPSRLKFMLMDLVDLRRKNWATKEENKGPKTLDEVRAEAEAAAAAKAQENARGNQRGPPGGRQSMGRGDARSFSNYGQQNSNQVGMDDLRRLKGGTGRTPGGSVTLGPTSMFSSRSNSGRRLGPGGSLGRPGEDSGASSRTGTPPTTHTNAFSALANLDSENPTSPPSTAASPALPKTVPDSTIPRESK